LKQKLKRGLDKYGEDIAVLESDLAKCKQITSSNSEEISYFENRLRNKTEEIITKVNLQSQTNTGPKTH